MILSRRFFLTAQAFRHDQDDTLFFSADKDMDNNHRVMLIFG